MQMTRRIGGGGGGTVRNEEATKLRNGLEEFVAAEGEPFGLSYASVVWGRSQDHKITSSWVVVAERP